MIPFFKLATLKKYIQNVVYQVYYLFIILFSVKSRPKDFQ